MLKNKTIGSISMLALALVLSACQPKSDQEKKDPTVDTQSSSEAQAPVLTLEGAPEAVPFNLPGCSGNSCPEFSIDRLHTNQFVLDNMIDQAIMSRLQQILEITDQAKAKEMSNKATQSADQSQTASDAVANLTPAQLLGLQVQPYVDQFIALDKELKNLGASSQISLSISPKILNSQEPLATVVLNTSSYLGGAHGSSSQTYYNFDLKHQKQVQLDEIIQPNQKQKLFSLAHDQFKTWVKDAKLAENIDEYEQAWKFSLSNNYYLGKKGLILQYAEYEIGPYVVGLPRLTIPYEQLNGIIKSEYLPKDVQLTQQGASAPVAHQASK
ncbi:DUF3298 domain-containing protein [Acinetobacter sp. 194]|uniref:RsiV family protein n=1 Tax=Acinetobacter shaoyimingii TaxID=2715164 RepID=UPI00140CE702|nr:RsiV family protein [Acinetobacter shaoyimingii]NHB56495.1 DUF3298 domain-containing protein [Acinetobacter shaoyimingii]